MRTRKPITATATIPAEVRAPLRDYIERRQLPQHIALGRLIASGVRRVESARRYRNSPKGKAARLRAAEKKLMARLLRAAEAEDVGVAAAMKATKAA